MKRNTYPHLRNGNWMQINNGTAYWPNDPQPEDIDIDVIARALSKICRYGGHVRDDEFYSVAEHSVLVSELVPPQDRLIALMHDAAEAFCGDVVRPIKVNLRDYAALEDKNFEAICRRFDLSPDIPQVVHDADIAMLFAERQKVLSPLRVGEPTNWGMGLETPITADPERIQMLPPRFARQLFLERFYDLVAERKVNG